MLALDDLLSQLQYTDSVHYRSNQTQLEPKTAHIFRVAYESAKVQGVYVFNSSPNLNNYHLLPARPAVYIAETTTEKDAREIHRLLWNLGYAPFVVIKLPHQIRIYTGFNYSYSEDGEESGLLSTIPEDRFNQLHELMADFSASAIDSGQIWESNYAKRFTPEQRIDQHLLKNLRLLGRALKQDGLSDGVAHALIGKYVYLSYLRHSNILHDDWLAEQNIDPDSIFTLQATIDSLQNLTEVLEQKINGKVFPIDFALMRHETLKDRHVSWVASVFSGTQIIGDAPNAVHQLHLPFKAYDFRYIPVETLSAIYEQFIDERKKIGAVYTPEFLADYLISEVEWVHELRPYGKLLDPACGSGVFLVLSYRRIIEKEMVRLGRNLVAEELKAILDNIYGIERERDACYVAEFSLILTFLHYVEPKELQNLQFRLPNLHNKQIFEMDFFDLKGEDPTTNFWQKNLKFDWIVGNPPWSSKLDSTRDRFALEWINKSKLSVSGKRIAEAFSWLVLELLEADGIIGLLMPATSLFSLNSRNYRQQFFTKNEILRITNFANLRDVLFGKGKSSVLPAATIIYRNNTSSYTKPDILHYGPFAVNQISKTQRSPWTITINENEIQTVSADEAELGNSSLWKFALWGTHLDKDVIERIEYMFPKTLDRICRQNAWFLQQGSELKNVNIKSKDKLEPVPELRGKKQFATDLIKGSLFTFSIEPHLLQDIPDEMCHIRVQGGKKGLNVTWAPHVVISPGWGNYIFFSNEDFVIRPRQIAISASRQSSNTSAQSLKAISIYLRSSLVAYYLFFHAQEWGVFRQAKRVATTQVGKIPTPDFTFTQIEELSALHETLVVKEREEITNFLRELLPENRPHLISESSSNSVASDLSVVNNLTQVSKKKLKTMVERLQQKQQKYVDDAICQMFDIPEDMQSIIREFMEVRLPLDTPSKRNTVTRKPTRSEFLAYTAQLKEELDSFSMGRAHYDVKLIHGDELAECQVKLVPESEPSSAISDALIKKGECTNAGILDGVSKFLRESLSQWIYVQRSLRLFDGPNIFIYKTPQLINWTRTQAMLDASDIIGEIITTLRNQDENDQA